jgi:hypothetical protein
MNDTAANTTKIRMIAKEVVGEQVRVCEERQGNLAEKLNALADTMKANATAISVLAQTVAVLANTVGPFSASLKATGARVDELEDDVIRLTRRPAFWAFIGSMLPVAAGVLWELIRTKP